MVVELTSIEWMGSSLRSYKVFWLYRNSMRPLFIVPARGMPVHAAGHRTNEKRGDIHAENNQGNEPEQRGNRVPAKGGV